MQSVLAVAPLRPVGMCRVTPAFAAVTLRWLHGAGERQLPTTNFGLRAQGVLVGGSSCSYSDPAVVDACLLPCPLPPSLAGPGFLADPGPPRPAPHPSDEWAFVECSRTLFVHTDSGTDGDGSSAALVAPLNGQLVCELRKDRAAEAHEDEDDRLVPGCALYLCEGCQRGFHLHCKHERLRQATEPSGRSLLNVSWSDPAHVRGAPNGGQKTQSFKSTGGL